MKMASYEVTETRYVDLPNRIGLNANGKVVMIDEKVNGDACIGSELSRYEGRLNDDYATKIIVEVLDDGEYEISAYRIRNGCTTIIFDGDEVYDDDILNVLGEACQAVEKDVRCITGHCDHSTNKCSDDTAGSFLRKLRKMIDAALDE